MIRRFLRVEAPFAAFRWLQAGVYRGTSPVMPPSAAYGLVMNLAGIETRLSGEFDITPSRADTPRIRIAAGLLSPPTRNSLYQQLHGYPVGASGKELAARTFGAKFWIAPVRREVLTDLRMVIGIEAEPDLLAQVERGLRGELPRAYGIPFAGDNNFFFDRLEWMEISEEVTWYCPVESGGGPGSCRLTVSIDRLDTSRTRQLLFAPSPPQLLPPDDAWTQVGPA